MRGLRRHRRTPTTAVSSDELMRAAQVVDALAAGTLDEPGLVEDACRLSAAMRLRACGDQRAPWPRLTIDRDRASFAYERPEGGHDPLVVSALHAFRHAAGDLARHWQSSPKDFAILGPSYGLPLSFEEIADVVAEWEIPPVAGEGCGS